MKKILKERNIIKVEDTANIRKIVSRGVFLLGMREHGGKELKRKLIEKFPAKEDEDKEDILFFIELAIEYLYREDLVSDERFIESYIRIEQERGQGPTKIEESLKIKTDRNDLVIDGLNSLDGLWDESASKLIKKKYNIIEKPQEEKEYAKIVRFLVSRGYGYDTIANAFEMLKD